MYTNSKSIEILSKSHIFGEIQKIEQTHASVIFLTKTHAYKLKKGVDFGFLNYTELNSRKKFCEAEVELNRRGADELYLEVLPIFEKNGEYTLIETPTIVDYVVKMNRFDESDLFLNILRDNKLDEDLIMKFAELLNNFHQKSKSSNDIRKFGKPEEVRKAFDQNFEQTLDYVGDVIDKKMYEKNIDLTNQFFANNNELFESRIKNKKIRQCHGDSHLGNICMYNNKIQLFDCIEFNDSFMYVDTMYDVAFTYMDLEVNGRVDLARIFLKEYVTISDDEEGLKILPIYLARQSYVRAKVNCFSLNQLENDKEREDLAKEIRKYFELSTAYLEQNFTN